MTEKDLLDKWLKLREQIKEKHKERLNSPFGWSVIYHTFLKDVLGLLEPFGSALQQHQKQLQNLWYRTRRKHKLEYENARLDRESGYVVSKPQQEFVDFLAWVEEELAKFIRLSEDLGVGVKA